MVELDRPHRLVLEAEMRVDGRAWLVGRLYWWSLVSFHALIFPVMRRNILTAAWDSTGVSDVKTGAEADTGK